MSLANVELKACSAGSNGGGFSMRGQSSLTLERVNIQNCKTRGMGGGLLAAGNSVIIKGEKGTQVSVEKSRARQGGGICCMSRIDLQGQSTVLIEDNEATEDGGGIFSFSSYAKLLVSPTNRLLIQRNQAANDGGGICLKQGAQISVESPVCGSSCTEQMRGNGRCDHGCMSAGCNWDEGMDL